MGCTVHEVDYYEIIEKRAIFHGWKGGKIQILLNGKHAISKNDGKQRDTQRICRGRKPHGTHKFWEGQR